MLVAEVDQQPRGSARLRQLYRVLLSVNRAVVRSTSAEALLGEVCRTVVEQAGLHSARAWVVDGLELPLRLVAASGAPTPRLDGLAVLAPVRALPADVSRLRIINDLAALEHPVEIGGLALEEGCRAIAGVPLRVEGRMLGLLALRGGEAGIFDATFEELLAELSAQVSFALSTFQAAAKEQQFRTLVENTTDGIFFSDLKGQYTWANHAALAMLGYSLDELRTKTVFDTNAPGEAVEFSRLEGAVTRQVGLKRKDGTVIEVEINARRTSDGYESICRPLAPRRRIEAQLLVTDRLVSLGTMASGVAHELNNPLSWIISNLSQARELIPQLAGPEEATRELGELLDESVEGAHRIVSIVSDLKTLARTDANRGRVSLNRVLERAASMVAFQVKYRGRLAQYLEPGLPDVQGSEAELRQVFVNLLQNAIQALPEGSPGKHEVELRAFADAAGRAVVEIRDTGCGIAPENVKRIFDPFFTTRPVGNGTGLGLSVAHNVVAQLGGSLELASSAVGKGSTFRVVLPPARNEPVNLESQGG